MKGEGRRAKDMQEYFSSQKQGFQFIKYFFSVLRLYDFVFYGKDEIRLQF